MTGNRVRPLRAGNLLAWPSQRLTDEVFETLLETSACRLERIISTGQATPPGQWYDQDNPEWVMLLSGAAGLLLEGETAVRELRPGDYIYIPAHRRHRVEWTAPQEPTFWLALHLREEACLPATS